MKTEQEMEEVNTNDRKYSKKAGIYEYNLQKKHRRYYDGYRTIKTINETVQRRSKSYDSAQYHHTQVATHEEFDRKTFICEVEKKTC